MLVSGRSFLSLHNRHQSLLHSLKRSYQISLVAHNYTLINTSSTNEIVKKSKFIAHAAPVASFEEAMVFLEKVKDTKANHNCWAYRSHTSSRCSDDGEPAGTAGRPILNILETENLVNAVIIVTRHFGGIKLGAGGLVRAYGGAAKSVIAQADKVILKPTTTVNVQVPMDNVGAVYNLLEQLQVKGDNGNQYRKLSEEFIAVGVDAAEREQNAMLFAFQVPADSVPSFQSCIADICRGKEIYVI